MNKLSKEQIKAYIGKAKYDSTGQMIFAVSKDDGLQLLVDVRGWGRIQNMFPTEQEAANFQDSIGEFIADAINTALTDVEGREEIDKRVVHINATPEFMANPKNIKLINEMVESAGEVIIKKYDPIELKNLKNPE